MTSRRREFHSGREPPMGGKRDERRSSLWKGVEFSCLLKGVRRGEGWRGANGRVGSLDVLSTKVLQKDPDCDQSDVYTRSNHGWQYEGMEAEETNARRTGVSLECCSSGWQEPLPGRACERGCRTVWETAQAGPGVGKAGVHDETGRWTAAPLLPSFKLTLHWNGCSPDSFNRWVHTKH